MSLEKRVLVLATETDHIDRTVSVLRAQRWLDVEHREGVIVAQDNELRLRFDVCSTVGDALRRLDRQAYSAILVDTRQLCDSMAKLERMDQALWTLLDAIASHPDREKRYPHHRLVVVVGGANSGRVDGQLFRLGQRHVGAFVRDASFRRGLTDEEVHHRQASWAHDLWQTLSRIVVRRRAGRRAISCSGGGITGVFYELGVLKCLNDAMGTTDIRDFDMYFGISAGAIVTSLIANGMPVEEAMERLGGLRDPSERLRISLAEVNWRGMLGRLPIAASNLGQYVRRVREGQEVPSLSGLAIELTSLMGPLFTAEEHGDELREMLSRPGMTNDFRKLKRKLYIGATDQDRRVPVLFGDEGWDDVAIHKAVQASSAIHPFFDAVEIKGRFYTDGVVTRTSNLRAAVAKGVDLLFIVDPFLPLISEEAGFNRRQSTLFLIEQDLKTISYTRFEGVSDEILRRMPEVACYTFVPSNRMRWWMARNPMSARNFDIIVTQAYQSTYRRLVNLEVKLAADLAAHGITLDLAPVRERVERLERERRPSARTLLA